MQKKQQGTVGVLRVAHVYQMLGYNVLLPLGDSQRYDLVIEKDGKLDRVQVKTTTEKRGVVTASTRVIGHNLKGVNIYHPTKTDFDILAVVEMKTQKVYAIPFDGSKQQIHFRTKQARNNQKRNVRLAHEYLLGP